MSVIEDSQKLTQIFGAWPSFHDAEVLRIFLDRSGDDAPTLEAEIHVFGATSELDSAGYYVLTNHTLVTLRFTGVALVDLGGFNEQNVLFNLEITELTPNVHDGRCWRVEMKPSYGVGATFECKRAVVTHVKPYVALAEP